jgi:hypothetical protein
MTCGCMWCPDHKKGLKVRASLMSALLFILVSSPQTYKLVQRLLGGIVTVASPAGLPTTAGLLIHALVFAAGVLLLMKLKKKRSYRY